MVSVANMPHDGNQRLLLSKMPWTLYRYIIRELLWVLLLSTTAVILALSFAMAVKPLADGYLGSLELMKFIIYTAPTMLQFALPFSGAFAAAMVFTRMTQDNEIAACAAGGMSYRRILLPVLILGLALMMGMFYLSNFVVPRYYEKAAETLKRDITRIVVARVRNRQTIVLRDWVISADDAAESPLTPEMARSLELADGDVPDRVIQLYGVAAARCKDGMLYDESSAKVAELVLFRHKGETCLRLLAQKWSRHDGSANVSGETWQPVDAAERTLSLPNPFEDKPQFLSGPDLSALLADSERLIRFRKVRECKGELAQVIAMEKLLRLITEELKKQGRADFVDAFNGSQQLRAPNFRRNGQALELAAAGDNPDAQVQVVEAQPRIPGRDMPDRVVTYMAARGTVKVSFARNDGAPRAAIELEKVRIRVKVDNQITVTDQERVRLPSVVWKEDVLPELRKETTASLMQLAGHEYAEARDVTRVAKWLGTLLDQYSRRSAAQLHQRAAFAITALLVLLLGSVSSILYRNRLPLVVFAGCFVVALVVVVVAYQGAYFAGNIQFPITLGLSIVWLGVGGLAALTLVQFVRITRH